MGTMGNFNSFLKGFRNVALILWLVVWKADGTDTEYSSRVIDRLQFSFPQHPQDCGKPPPQTSRNQRTTIKRRKVGFSPRLTMSTFKKDKKTHPKVIVQKVMAQALGMQIWQQAYAEHDTRRMRVTQMKSRRSKSFVRTSHSCIAFRWRRAFASTAMHILKASFNLPVNDLANLFPLLP